MNVRACVLGLASVGLLAVASCAAQPGVPPRQSPVGPEPRSVDEAQADIDRWGAELGIAPPPSGASGEKRASEAAPTVSDHPAAPPSAPPATQSSPTSVSASESASGADRSECVMPCRAIASMRRSVAALCRLAGEDDPRCVAAKKTLDEGERRVARCGC